MMGETLGDGTTTWAAMNLVARIGSEGRWGTSGSEEPLIADLAEKALDLLMA